MAHDESLSDPSAEKMGESFALKNHIEAILYLKGESLDLGTLAQLARCSQDDAYEAVLELVEDYAYRDSALEVVAEADRFALQLRDPFLALVNDLLPPEIGVGTSRTLATIILKGPLSQSQLVEMRGPGAYHHVAELVEKGFVSKYRKAGSRSAFLRVTDKFHRYFSVDELAAAHLDDGAWDPGVTLEQEPHLDEPGLDEQE